MGLLSTLTASTPVRRSRGQGLIASGLLLSNGVIHVVAFPDHFQVAAYIGVLFLLLALATVPLAIGIGADSQIAWDIAAAMSGIAIIAYVLARTLGLPFYHESSWLDMMGPVPLGLLSVIVEALFLLMYVRGEPGLARSGRRYFA